jgi:hypothetical protein
MLYNGVVMTMYFTIYHLTQLRANAVCIFQNILVLPEDGYKL